MTSRDLAREIAAPSVVTLVADGLRPDTLRVAIASGEVPALARLASEGALHDVTTVFPSVTGPAYVPFLAGRFPGPVGIPGLRWYDRARTVTSFPGWSRSYVGISMPKVNTDLSVGAPTMFELVPSCVAALSVIERGLSPHDRLGRGAGFVARAAVTHFRGDVRGWLDIDRMIAARFADRVGRERPEFAFCALTGIDKASHSRGHDDQLVRDALRIVDQAVGRIRDDAERSGRWDTMRLQVVSDHGHSPVRAHEDLAGVVRSWDCRVLAHPWAVGVAADVAVMVSGNAMAHLYVDLPSRERRWWPALGERWSWLADQLLARESVDLMLLPHGTGRCHVRSRGRGAAFVEFDGARFSYRPDTGDPLGLGALERLSADDALDATRASDYPDAVVQIAHLAGSARAGDIILSATRGWDFRAKWEPIPHVSTHGALHREHMMVPLLLNRPPARAPRRTVDVMPSALAALGRRVPAGLDGASYHGDGTTT